METEKTIVCKISEPDKSKLEAIEIEEEYYKAQGYIRGGTEELCFATK